MSPQVTELSTPAILVHSDTSTIVKAVLVLPVTVIVPPPVWVVVTVPYQISESPSVEEPPVPATCVQLPEPVEGTPPPLMPVTVAELLVPRSTTAMRVSPAVMELFRTTP